MLCPGSLVDWRLWQTQAKLDSDNFLRNDHMAIAVFFLPFQTMCLESCVSETMVVAFEFFIIIDSTFTRRWCIPHIVDSSTIIPISRITIFITQWIHPCQQLHQAWPGLGKDSIGGWQGLKQAVVQWLHSQQHMPQWWKWWPCLLQKQHQSSTSKTQFAVCQRLQVTNLSVWIDLPGQEV